MVGFCRDKMYETTEEAELIMDEEEEEAEASPPYVAPVTYPK